jgi:hypothetical protein
MKRLGIIERAQMAYNRGRLLSAALGHLRPYVTGSLLLLTRNRANITLTVPEVRPVETSDHDLMPRLFESLQKMKADEPRASSVYRPSSFWKAITGRYPVTTFDQFQVFLSNFGTWDDVTYIEHGQLLRRSLKFPPLRRYCEDVLFGRPLDLWRSFIPGKVCRF